MDGASFMDDASDPNAWRGGEALPDCVQVSSIVNVEEFLCPSRVVGL